MNSILILASMLFLVGVQELVLDSSKIRFGDKALFDHKRGDAVGTIRSPEVYETIEAYKTIRKEGVTEGSARWQQLMLQATEVYKASMRSVASEQSLVLIVEEGGISNYKTVDITNKAIHAIKL